MKFTVLPESWSPSLLSVLRIMAGLAFLEHGTGKLLNFPVLPGIADMMPHGLLVFTGAMELVGGALIVVGFLTRPAAFVLAGFMAAAYFMAHFPMGFFPANNHGEAALLYCFVFLYIAAAGAGPWSVDSAASGRERSNAYPSPAE